MTAGRITTMEYLTRHVFPHLTTAQQATMTVIGTEDRRGNGRVRMTNFDIAEKRRKSERTIRKQTGRLVKDGTWLRRSGWTWIIVGAAEHDVRDCDHPDCRVDAAADSRIAAADELAELRRKRDRERKRADRAARKARQLAAAAATTEPAATPPSPGTPDTAALEPDPVRQMPRPAHRNAGPVEPVVPAQGHRWVFDPLPAGVHSAPY